MGNLVRDRPFKRIFRETEEAHSGLVGGENKSFIEEAAYIEEEIQELSTRGLLPFEQRVKQRRITGKQPAPYAGVLAEASPGGGCIATPEDKVKPNWKVNKQARVLYAVSEAKSRRMDESYKDRYEYAYLDWRNLNPNEQRRWTDKANGTTRSEGPLSLIHI